MRDGSPWTDSCTNETKKRQQREIIEVQSSIEIEPLAKEHNSKLKNQGNLKTLTIPDMEEEKWKKDAYKSGRRST